LAKHRLKARKLEASINYRKKFIVEPGSKVRLAKIDPSYSGKHKAHKTAVLEMAKEVERMDRLQYLLYADGGQSLLIVLQALVRPERTESLGTCSPA
jgi:hypothetical protein